MKRIKPNSIQETRKRLVKALMFDPDPKYTMAIFSTAQANNIMVEIEMLIRLIIESKP